MRMATNVIIKIGDFSLEHSVHGMHHDLPEKVTIVTGAWERSNSRRHASFTNKIKILMATG